MVSITIRVDETVRERLRAIAVGAGVEVSDVVRVGLSRVLADVPTVEELGRAERAEGGAAQSEEQLAAAGKAGAAARWKTRKRKKKS